MFVTRGSPAGQLHLQLLAIQKDETVRNTGRNMLAGRMQRTPTNTQIFCFETVSKLHPKLTDSYGYGCYVWGEINVPYKFLNAFVGKVLLSYRKRKLALVTGSDFQFQPIF